MKYIFYGKEPHEFVTFPDKVSHADQWLMFSPVDMPISAGSFKKIVNGYGCVEIKVEHGSSSLGIARDPEREKLDRQYLRVWMV